MPQPVSFQFSLRFHVYLSCIFFKTTLSLHVTAICHAGVNPTLMLYTHQLYGTMSLLDLVTTRTTSW